VAVLTLLLLSRAPGFTTYANNATANVWIYELNLLACVGVVLWALSGRFVGVLRLTPIRFLGRVSYTVYLVHLTMMVEVARYVGDKALAAGIAAVITLIYASVSWVCMERPLLERKRAVARASGNTSLEPAAE
jgi:peptidoglycan/LPS O-acetylase OafA/YrhL